MLEEEEEEEDEDNELFTGGEEALQLVDHVAQKRTHSFTAHSGSKAQASAVAALQSSSSTSRRTQARPQPLAFGRAVGEGRRRAFRRKCRQYAPLI